MSDIPEVPRAGDFYVTHVPNTDYLHRPEYRGSLLQHKRRAKPRWARSPLPCPFCELPMKRLERGDSRLAGRVVRIGPERNGERWVVASRAPKDIAVFSCKPCDLGFTMWPKEVSG